MLHMSIPQSCEYIKTHTHLFTSVANLLERSHVLQTDKHGSQECGIITYIHVRYTFTPNTQTATNGQVLVNSKM